MTRDRRAPRSTVHLVSDRRCIKTRMRAEPTLDQPFDAAALLRSVRRLEQRLSDSINGGLEDLGLTTSLYLSLDALDREPRVHASQLARNLGITRQSVHALVVKLRRMDLVDLLPLDLGVRGLVSPTSVDDDSTRPGAPCWTSSPRCTTICRCTSSMTWPAWPNDASAPCGHGRCAGGWTE
jgi:MarR family